MTADWSLPGTAPAEPVLSSDSSGRVPSWLDRLWEPVIAVPLALGIGLRLLLLPWFSDPYNFFGSYAATDILVRGLDPFQAFSGDAVFGELNPWGYPGLYFVVTLFARSASLGDPYLFGVWLKLPSVVLDAGTAVLLYRIARQAGASEGTSRLVSVAFLFNPFSILVTSVWGVNDPLPVFFTVLAIYFLLRSRAGDLDLASLSVGVGVALKLYPVLLLPLLLGRARSAWAKVRAVALVGAVPALTSLPFLLTSGTAYLNVLFGFASGAEETGLDPQRTLLSAVAWFAGPLDPRVALVPAGALVLVLVWVYRRTRDGRLHPILGATVGLTAAFLLAVRWIPNYALWAVPFATLQAFLFLRGRWRWVPGTFWAPAMADAVIYMGWYPNPLSGASGLPYWALLANGPPIKMVDLVPPGTLAVLGGLFLAGTAGTLYLALRAGFVGVPRSTKPPRTAWPGRPRASLVASALFLVLLGGGVASGYFQSLDHGAVTPTDFASFVPQADGSVAVHDDFRARFLSFRWSFQGTGSYALRPGGEGSILLDTETSGGTAYLEDPVTSRSLEVTVAFRLLHRYGTDPLVLASGPGGWLGIAGPPAVHRLVYLDEESGTLHRLGVLGSGWHAATLRFDLDQREIRGGGTTLTLDGAGAVDGILIGHHPTGPRGGGILEVSAVDLGWMQDAPAPDGPPVWTVLGSGLGFPAALLVPALLRRRIPPDRSKGD